MTEVSVVLAFRNRADRIERALRSLSYLDRCGYELIAVDGESTDASPQLVQAYEPEWLLNAPPRGVYEAWNLALSYCSQEWVLFLNSDDVFMEAVDLLVREAESTETFAVFGTAKHVAANGQERELGFDFLARNESLRLLMLARGTFPFNAAVYRTSTLREYGGFDCGLTYLADRELVQRILADGRNFDYRADLNVYKYLLSEDSLTMSGSTIPVTGDLHSWAAKAQYPGKLVLEGLSLVNRLRRTGK